MATMSDISIPGNMVWTEIAGVDELVEFQNLGGYTVFVAETDDANPPIAGITGPSLAPHRGVVVSTGKRLWARVEGAVKLSRQPVGGV